MMPPEVVVERVVAFAAAPARAHIAAVRRAPGRDESDLCFSRRIGRETATVRGDGLVGVGGSQWCQASLLVCVCCFSPLFFRVFRPCATGSHGWKNWSFVIEEDSAIMCNTCAPIAITSLEAHLIAVSLAVNYNL
jgi:hypothetical protein